MQLWKGWGQCMVIFLVLSISRETSRGHGSKDRQVLEVQVLGSTAFYTVEKIPSMLRRVYYTV